MPNLSSNQTALRASGHKRRVFVSDLSGEVVATYEVGALPSATSAFNVTTTLSSGSSSDVQHGMRVVVETAGGLPKGVLNVRSNGPINDTNLPVREVSKGQVALAIGDVLKVYDDFPLVDKLTDATSAFAPDAEAYSDQYSDPKPLVGSGGYWAGWLADAAAIPLDGSASLNLDPDTADTLTHLWAATGGTLSSTSAASPTVDFSGAGAGTYRLKHTVTAANGKARVQNTRYRIHDADDPPIVGTEESPMQGDSLNGWSYSIRVYDADAFTLSPLAPVVVWVDETINGTRQSFGAKVAGRSHIKCMGYLRRARTGFDENEGRYYVIYDIVSALEMLRELPGFSKVFQHDQTPANWNEQKTLTHRRAWLYLALYYTNANEAGHDLVLDDGGMMNKAYAAFFIQKTDPLAQWLELAAGVDCRVTCDRSGRIECQQRLELIPLASRGGVTTTLTLTKADIISYEMEHDFKEPVETFRARGFTAGSTGNNPLFARWPASPGYGNQSQTDEKLVCDNVADHYARTAMRGAYANRTFTNADRVKRHAPKMTVRLPGSYDCFDLYKEWVGAGDIDDPRVDTSFFRWLVEAIRYVTDRGTGENELTLQGETNGYDAVDDTPPAESDNGLQPWTPPGWSFDPFPIDNLPTDPGSGLRNGTTTIAAFRTDNVVQITTDAETPAAQGGPTWIEVDYSASVVGNTVDFVFDAFSPGHPGGGNVLNGATNGTILTDDTDCAFNIDDIFGIVSRTITSTTAADPFIDSTSVAGRGRIIESHWASSGALVVVSNYRNASGHTGTWYRYSTDRGATWSTETQVSAGYDTNAGGNNVGGLFVSTYNPGTALLSANTNIATGIAATAAFFRLSSGFASFAEVTTPSDFTPQDGGGFMFVPFEGNTSDDLVYFSRENQAAGLSASFNFHRKQGGIVSGHIGPVESGVQLAPIFKRAFHVSPENSNVMAGVFTSPNAAISAIYASTDGGTTWVRISSGTTTAYNSIHVTGRHFWCWGSAGAFGYGSIDAMTIDDRSGNISTSARITNITGGGRVS